MRSGETGMPVRLLQQALIDLGHPLPKSTRKYGSPDGMFGSEVVQAVKAYQGSKGLSRDGVVGKGTLEKMDIEVSALPDPPPLPPLPTGDPQSSTAVNYTVPGTLTPVRQDSGMRCWAAMYAMMLQWRRQMSMPTRACVVTLGEPYIGIYDRDEGLSIQRNRELATKAGMQAEYLMNLSAQGWERMLRRHGLLWTSYAWEVLGAAPQAGRHIVILYGIQGDGSAFGTKMKFIDPEDGRFHEITLGAWVSRHELGGSTAPNDNATAQNFSQIMHY